MQCLIIINENYLKFVKKVLVKEEERDCLVVQYVHLVSTLNILMETMILISKFCILFCIDETYQNHLSVPSFFVFSL